MLKWQGYERASLAVQKENYAVKMYKNVGFKKKEDMVALLQANTAYELNESIGSCSANVHIFIGQKENKGIKNSALQVQKMIPDAEINILPDLYHGEFSLNHADDYVKAVERILNGE